MQGSRPSHLMVYISGQFLAKLYHNSLLFKHGWLITIYLILKITFKSIALNVIVVCLFESKNLASLVLNSPTEM